LHDPRYALATGLSTLSSGVWRNHDGKHLASRRAGVETAYTLLHRSTAGRRAPHRLPEGGPTARRCSTPESSQVVPEMTQRRPSEVAPDLDLSQIPDLSRGLLEAAPDA